MVAQVAHANGDMRLALSAISGAAEIMARDPAAYAPAGAPSVPSDEMKCSASKRHCCIFLQPFQVPQRELMQTEQFADALAFVTKVHVRVAGRVTRTYIHLLGKCRVVSLLCFAGVDTCPR